jgi:hypothetical protein
VVAINDRMEQRFPVRLDMLDDLNAGYVVDASVQRPASFE